MRGRGLARSCSGTSATSRSLWVHGREPKESDWLRWYRSTISRGLAHASAVVAPSEWMLNSVRSSYSGGTREVVIHNGRNPIFFNPYVTKEDGVLSIGR